MTKPKISSPRINVYDNSDLLTLSDEGPRYINDSTLDDLISVALNHSDWVFRLRAIACLGRNIKRKDGVHNYDVEQALNKVSLYDQHPSNRYGAAAWLTDYDAELIKYKCQAKKSNPFGQEWRQLDLPLNAIIGAIDTDGYNTELYRIGLSAMQMDNLRTERKTDPLGADTVLKIMHQNKNGLLDGQDFGEVTLSFMEKRASAQVYNAFGSKSIGGCGVRISSILAEDFGAELEDTIILHGTS